MMKAKVVPYHNVPVPLMVCIIHTLWSFENVAQSVQKCEKMGCVVWSKVGMTVEDTGIGDGSTHCDIPTMLARNIMALWPLTFLPLLLVFARLNPASCGIV